MKILAIVASLIFLPFIKLQDCFFEKALNSHGTSLYNFTHCSDLLSNCCFDDTQVLNNNKYVGKCVIYNVPCNTFLLTFPFHDDNNNHHIENDENHFAFERSFTDNTNSKTQYEKAIKKAKKAAEKAAEKERKKRGDIKRFLK
jgi:hypothetical protein